MSLASAPNALVAVDEGLVSILIEDILASRGYHVTVVNTRAQLLDILPRRRWSLAVTDTDLAFADEIRSWQVPRVVLCSGMPEHSLRQHFPGLPYIRQTIPGSGLRSHPCVAAPESSRGSRPGI